MALLHLLKSSPLGIAAAFFVLGVGVTAVAQAEHSPHEPSLEHAEGRDRHLEQTVLYFETRRTAVRVYRHDGQLYMNVYNKETDTTELRAAPARIVSGEADGELSYVAQQGEARYSARTRQAGRADLEIRRSDRVLLREEGYNVTTTAQPSSSASSYKGNDFELGAVAVVPNNTTPVREQPMTESPVVTTLRRGTPVDILDRVNNPQDGYIWYQVLIEPSTAGWIRGDLLAPD